MNKQIRIVIFLAFMLFLFSSTNAQGILDAVVQKSPTTFEARNTDDIHCGYRTAKAGEQINFICPENPKLRVDVDSNVGLSLANVGILIDGEFGGITNIFGFQMTPIQSGLHDVTIVYRLDENRPFFMQEKQVNIGSALSSIGFVASEEKGIPIGGLSESEEKILPANVDLEAVLTLVGATTVLLFMAIQGKQTWDYCSCLVTNIPNSPVSEKECNDILTVCNDHPESCNLQRIRDLNFGQEVCPEEYETFALNILSEGTGKMATGGIIAGATIQTARKGAKAATIAKKLPSGAEPLVEIQKNKGEPIWKTISHHFEHKATWVKEKLKLLFQMKAGNKLLSEETTNYIDKAVNTKRITSEVGQFMRDALERKILLNETDEMLKKTENFTKATAEIRHNPNIAGEFQTQKILKARKGIDAYAIKSPDGKNIIKSSQKAEETVIVSEGYHIKKGPGDYGGHGRAHFEGERTDINNKPRPSHAEEIKENCELRSLEEVYALVEQIIQVGDDLGGGVYEKKLGKCKGPIRAIVGNTNPKALTGHFISGFVYEPP